MFASTSGTVTSITESKDGHFLEKRNKKRKIIIFGSIGILLIAIVFIAIIVELRPIDTGKSTTVKSGNSSEKTTLTALSTIALKEGYKLFTDNIYPYSIQVPQNYEIITEGDGMCGTVFNSSNSIKGFTICNGGGIGIELTIQANINQIKSQLNASIGETFIGEGDLTIDGNKAYYIEYTSRDDTYGDIIRMEIFIDHVLHYNVQNDNIPYNLVVVGSIDKNNESLGKQELLDILYTMRITK